LLSDSSKSWRVVAGLADAAVHVAVS
jgi:hypothetical protein